MLVATKTYSKLLAVGLTKGLPTTVGGDSQQSGCPDDPDRKYDNNSLHLTKYFLPSLM